MRKQVRRSATTTEGDFDRLPARNDTRNIIDRMLERCSEREPHHPLRDTDGDGVADARSVLLSGLNAPFGMALIGDRLFVANVDVVLSFPYQTADLATLIEYVADIPGIERIRYTTSHPNEFTPALIASAVVPDDALGPHTASLGLALSSGSHLPAPFNDGMFVGQHGSWNRRPHSGYKVVFIPFRDGKRAGLPLDVLTGFLGDAGDALGRPVRVVIDKQGALLVADDVGNVIWRVSAKP